MIYKELIPINVNDSVLDVKANNNVRRKKSSVNTLKKDPEPQLTGYLRAIELQKNHHKLNLDDIDIEVGSGQRNDLNSNFRELFEFYQQNLCPRKCLSTSIFSTINN